MAAREHDTVGLFWDTDLHISLCLCPVRKMSKRYLFTVRRLGS